MSNHDRRRFLQLLGAGALATALPGSVARAMSIPAHRRTGTIDDVEHVVVLTQENRSFDHLFGTLRGVRGFGDPHVARLPSGKPVWYQPDGLGHVLPFKPQVPNLDLGFLPDPPHGWNDSHRAVNGGRYDQWVAAKGVSAMGHLTRAEVPFHFALADAFTICDAYFCSLIGPTDPNRYHLFTGWTGNDGQNGGPVLSNAEVGYDWSSYPERLELAGISWKVYQDVGVGLDANGYWGWTEDPYIGNYGDNSLLYLHQYQNAPPGSPLALRAKTGTNIRAGGTLFDVLREDVRTGQLPQVSYLAAPEAFSEHPNWPSNYGAWYISQVLDILTSNPEVWSKTVLFINYDENGGYFDHLIPPAPEAGRSTVDTVNELYPGGGGFVAGPYGLGQRVPMLVVSPWSRGGYVNSQVFDHTSVIRFLEARFGPHHPGLVETNITPWRRAVVGDLTSAFDFAAPHARPLSLPDTSTYRPPDALRHPDAVVLPPAQQALPVQERGVRKARALPYELEVQGRLRLGQGTYQLRFLNSGEATAVFHARSSDPAEAPRSYTVEPGQHLSGEWPVRVGDAPYALEVFGPNGFTRTFRGGAIGPRGTDLEVRTEYLPSGDVSLTVQNLGGARRRLVVTDRATGASRTERLASRARWSERFPAGRRGGWYDLVLTVDEDPGFALGLAGHVETGRDSVSDPALGGDAELPELSDD